MQLQDFGVLDLMMRAIILLGVILMTFSNFSTIRKNRIANDKMKTIKYYNNFFIQQFPLYSSYMASILLGIGLFRIGSLLHVDMNSTPYMKIANLMILQPEITLKYKNIIFGVSLAGGIMYIASCILYNLSQVQISKNFSLFVDIKEDYKLYTNDLYKLVRHPMYLFEILFYVTASITLLSWALLLWVLIIHIPLTISKAKAEDRILEEHFGDKFLKYKAKVGGFIPGIKWSK